MRLREAETNWRVPLVSAMGTGSGVTHLYTLGVLMQPIEREFDWYRSQTAAGLTIVSVLSVICSPLVGSYIDRHGPRTVALLGLIVYSCAIMSLATTGSSIFNWWGLWIFVGLGAVLLKPPVWTAAIARQFEAGRAFAMGLALCGTGIASATFPMVATLLQFEFGWRVTLVAFGLWPLLVTLPLVWLFFRYPESEHPLPAERAGRQALWPAEVRRSLKSRRFLTMALAGFLMTIGIAAVLIHLIPIMTECGFAPTRAAAIASLLGVSAIVGRLGSGLLLDRIRGPRVGVVVFLLPIAGAILLLAGDHPALAIVATILFGLAAGSELDVLAYFASRYFGRRYYASLFAILIAAMGLGTGLGPLLAGFLHDMTGSYRMLFVVIIPLYVVASCLLATLGDFPSEGRSEAGPETVLPPVSRTISQQSLG